ncbi:ATP-binding protein [Actinoplanes xinjiangensis]|uniref:ATP-binding protein n=1 Tax=Actinoplanes xinjiangensis TaxID=512350 RepID=UPI00342CDBEA
MILLQAIFGRDDPASPLRRTVQAVLGERFGAAADDAWADDVLIAVSELVQNVVQHTGGDGRLTLSATADGLLIEVADTAVTPPRLRHPDPRHAGGRGLLLIDAMALRWGTRHHDDGKTVWAVMPTSALAAASSA